MVRSILAVFAGMVTWAVLWLGTNAAVAALVPGSFNDDGTTDSLGLLLVFQLASLLFSVLAGYVTARVAQKNGVKHAMILGVIQLLIGIAVQAGYWDLMPLWYHLVFLALLLPGNVLGGWLHDSRT